MDESHPTPPGPHPGLLVYKLDTALFELLQGGRDVLDFEGDVVKTRAAFAEEFSDRRILAGRLQKLDLRFPDAEHHSSYALLGDLFGLAGLDAEAFHVEPGRRLQILDRVAEVFYLLEQASPLSCIEFYSIDAGHTGSLEAVRLYTASHERYKRRKERKMAKSVMQRIQELSKRKEDLVAREGTHHATDQDRETLSRLDHDLQVLWDLRRRELAGEEVSLDEDYFDRYTVDPGNDAPGR